MPEYSNDFTTSNNEEGAASAQITTTEQTPFLDQWGKTPYGMFVLGLIIPTLAFYMVIAFAASFLRTAPTAYVLFVVAFGVAVNVFYFVYALKTFPSLHTDKPMLKSRYAVAFLNAFVGGIIFGSIWCSSLTTKRKKNTSPYVFAALLAILLVFEFATNVVPTLAAPTATSGTAHTYQVTGYTDGDAEVWYPASGSVSFSGKSVSFSASCNGKQYSGSGDFLDVEEGFDVYALRDGTYAAHGTAEGVRMLMVLTEDHVLYALLLE